VCVPQAADQFFNAAAAVRSGIGFAFQPDEVGVTAVRDAVQRLLTESAYSAAARRISTEIAAMPDARAPSRERSHNSSAERLGPRAEPSNAPAWY
jgi:UDP:flavonoid glycosyltransferase YjiC (YdhE family)